MKREWGSYAGTVSGEVHNPEMGQIYNMPGCARRRRSPLLVFRRFSPTGMAFLATDIASHTSSVDAQRPYVAVASWRITVAFSHITFFLAYAHYSNNLDS